MNKKEQLTVLANRFQTMTSREIAGPVDSRHDKVRQGIERLVERGVIIQPPVEWIAGQTMELAS